MYEGKKKERGLLLREYDEETEWRGLRRHVYNAHGHCQTLTCAA